MRAPDVTYQEGKPPTFSASQISTYLECPRKWAFDKIGKVPRSTHPSAALGTRMHTHLERWLTTGEAPLFTLEDGSEDLAGEIASGALDYLPPPMDQGLEVERSFNFQSERTGFFYRGFIDWWHPLWTPPQTDWEALPTVGDHKSTSDINRYAKSEADLETDPQAIIYSRVAVRVFQASRVRLQWTYVQTRGSRKVLPVWTEFDAEYVDRAFDALEDVTTEMAEILRTVTKDEIKAKVPGVLTHCREYGGCPYRFMCQHGPGDLNPPGAPAAPGRPFTFA